MRVITKQAVEEHLSSSHSISNLMTKIGVSKALCNYKAIRKIINDNNLSTSHFTVYHPGLRNYKDLLLGIDKSGYSSHKLKALLVKHGILENKCSRCGLTQWLGDNISLELDHKDGVSNNNRLSNLEILCPNCHSQTPTFRAKNRNKIAIIAVSDMTDEYIEEQIKKIPERCIVRKALTKEQILESLSLHKSLEEAAKYLSVTRRTLSRKMTIYGIKKD